MSSTTDNYNHTGAEKNGKVVSVGEKLMKKGAEMLQSLKPINEMSQHVCTFALYSHDMTRQIETHHFLTRLNQDFLQSADYDSDDSNAHLIATDRDHTGGEKNGKAVSVGEQIMKKGAEMLQSLKPINEMSQHVCTFALYSHDMTRQIETHHFLTRLNQDFLQSAVYDSDDSNARLIGVEYIISDTIFEKLPPEEQKLWHSHAYEVKSGLWVHPRMPEMLVKPELKNLAKTYGKFWCTWQTDRGDKLPLGPPSLMMSPQAEGEGVVSPDLVKKRDDKYNVSKEDFMKSRIEIPEPEWINPVADNWRQHNKCFQVDVEPTEIKTDFP